MFISFFSEHNVDGKIEQAKDASAYMPSTPPGIIKQCIVKEFYVTLLNGQQLLIQKRYRQTLHYPKYCPFDLEERSRPRLISITVLKGEVGTGWNSETVLPETERVENE